MNSNNFLMEMMFIFSTMMFLMMKNHFLISLIFLEIMSLSIYFLILNMGDGSMPIIFLMMMVMEAALGLSLVVSNSRKMGGDFLTL